MKLSKKTSLIILISWAVIVVATQLLRNFSLMERAAIWIRVLFLILAIIPFIFPLLAQFLRHVRGSTWFRIAPYFILIYYGLLLILVSVNKDIFAGISYWDTSMTGLGVAVVAFGLMLFTQHRPREIQKTEGEFNTNISGLGKKVVALSKKFNKLENKINTILGESQKLNERLTELQKEDKSKDNQTKL